MLGRHSELADTVRQALLRCRLLLRGEGTQTVKERITELQITMLLELKTIHTQKYFQ